VPLHERRVVAEERIESLHRLLGTGERHEAIAGDRIFAVGADDELIHRTEGVEPIGHCQRAGQWAAPMPACEAPDRAHGAIRCWLVESVGDDQECKRHAAQEAEAPQARGSRDRQGAAEKAGARTQDLAGELPSFPKRRRRHRCREIVVVTTPREAFRHEALAGELALRPNEREQILEREAAIGRSARLRIEAERHPGLDSERARIAEKQSGEIRAEVPEERLGVACRAGARVKDSAIREHHLQTEDAVG